MEKGVEEKKSSIIPEKATWLRALVSAIPYAGGALDHLLFDKADSIRARNVDEAISSINKKLGDLPENIIDKDWFASEEALAVFRSMAEKIEFEPDAKKRCSLANVVAISGTRDFSSDKRKLSILEHLNRLSFVQMRIISILSLLQPKQQKVGQEIVQNVTGLWFEQIVDSLKTNPYGQFWDGQLNVIIELEILESLNMIRSLPLIAGPDKVYTLTGLGLEAARYFRAGNQ